MSASLARRAARSSAVFAAVLALTATTSFTANAQEDPATPSTPVTAPSTPAEPTAPAEPTTPAESSAPAAPPVAEQPVEKPAQQPAERSNVQATIEIAAGPFLVGQVVPFKLVVTNSGAGEATGAGAWMEHISGSYLSMNREDWDGLQAPWGEPSTLKIAAGETRTFTLKGRTYGYQATRSLGGASIFLARRRTA